MLRFITRIFKNKGVEGQNMISREEYLEYEGRMILIFGKYHQLLIAPERISQEKAFMEDIGLEAEEIHILREFLDKRGFEGIHGYPLERPKVPYTYMVAPWELERDHTGNVYYDAWSIHSAPEVLESTRGLVPNLERWNFGATAGLLEAQVFDLIKTLDKEGFYPCPPGQPIKLYARDEQMLEFANHLESLWLIKKRYKKII